jgi:hypothetical protein
MAALRLCVDVYSMLLFPVSMPRLQRLEGRPTFPAPLQTSIWRNKKLLLGGIFLVLLSLYPNTKALLFNQSLLNTMAFRMMFPYKRDDCIDEKDLHACYERTKEGLRSGG